MTPEGGSGQSRIDKLRQRLNLRASWAFLITNLINIKYLTGFSGSSAYLLVSGVDSYFFTDFRYKEQAAAAVGACDIIITKKDPVRFIVNFIEKKKITKLAFEDTLSYRTLRMFKQRFQVKALRDTVEGIRIIKDATELWHIRRAAQRAESALSELKPRIKAGVTEKAIALMLEEGLKAQGVDSIPFEIIVASGRRSSMPHARATDKVLEQGDLLIIDWGGDSGGYYSDMTRTFLVGGGNDLGKKKEIYDIVLKANEEARASVRRGHRASDVDGVARSVIKDVGYGRYFGHSTGHGIGMEVHELPYISAMNRKQKIDEGMVFTVEPGIYIPEIGGVRIEDMVCVTGQTAETITSLSRDLEVL
ncbi:M24 family metallopeptidase [Candidatus Magnetominusculus dajiuhuensis]|uniref:M24 family metallopeptidase n=1 Tax=Candidatus Magnetominusculus dajiuhuensis TaxID=3137712 RepID=UPI003B43096D